VAGRERVADALKAQGIPAAVYYPQCLREQPVFAGLGYQWGDFPEAERASREVLSLPMHPGLTEPDQDRILSAFSFCLKT
jgi:UDP-2-acetamido-2-deoxy-ribo-hexuluronate aminotransferase